MKKTINKELIQDELMLDISSFTQYLVHEAKTTRHGEYPFSEYSLTWKIYDAERDDYDAVAKMELYCARFKEAEDGFEPMDYSGEALCVYDYAYEYAQNMEIQAWLPFEEREGLWEPAQFVYIKHFYVSPKYRGLGLSVQLLMSLTRILPDIGYSSNDMIIAIIVRPFKKQKRLTINGRLSSSCFGEYLEDDNVRHKKMIDKMVAPLLTCGFVKCDSDEDIAYVTTYKNLFEKAMASGYCDEEEANCPITEYTYW